jgi:2-C-methyl-D-erythritol 4-phosphate cytidylyltransferase
MNIAVVLAGGTGNRMGASVPKQFMHVLGKPVIVYTLEVFESHPDIDAIEVVLLEGYEDQMQKYKEEYNLTKLKWITTGGANFQESVYNGVTFLENHCTNDDIIMLAMSVCPLITDDIITDSLEVCNKYGNAISADNSIYNLSTLRDGYWANNYVLKEEHVTLNLPWTFPYGKLLWAYKKAHDTNTGMDDRSYTTTLMIDLGEKLYFSKDSASNRLKMTTFDDVDMLEGYLLIQELRKGNTEAACKIREQKEPPSPERG